jgi:magnesium transporter
MTGAPVEEAPGPAPEEEDGAEAGPVSPDFVREIAEALEEGRPAEAVERARVLHAADLADLVEALKPDERVALIEALGPALDPEVLVDLDDHVRDLVLETIEPEAIAAHAAELDTDDATHLIEDLDRAEQEKILEAMPAGDRELLATALTYPENSAGRLMQRDYVAVPSYWNVGQVIDWLRETDELPEEFYEIFVVDPRHRPVGTVPLNRAMRTKRPVRVADIMDPEPRLIPVDMDQEEVAYQFDQYGLASAAVVGPDGRLLGQITVDDVVDVIQEEAEEDIHRLGGVSAEGDLYLGALATVRRRWVWLLVNLVTAVIASLTIALFADTIQQLVALAVLMPIVASMGGNAGTQTLTVAVRALATRELTAANAARMLWKECMVGGTNGILFAVVTGVVAAVWFSSAIIGVVIGLAMIVNLLVAGAAGMLIPLGLQRAGVDPAISAGIFLTTITDVVGFFAFLGLAKLIIL